MSARLITREEFKKHNNLESLWIAVHGNVYDVTEFVNKHPGGTVPLTFHGGKDATFGFDKKGHSDKAKELRDSMLVGKLEEVTGWTWQDYLFNIGIPAAMVVALYLYARRF